MTTTTTIADAYEVRRFPQGEQPGVEMLAIRRRDGEAFTRFTDLFSIKEAHAPNADVVGVDLWTWLRDAQTAAAAAAHNGAENGAPEPDRDVAADTVAAAAPAAAATPTASISVAPRTRRGATLNLSRAELRAMRADIPTLLAGSPNLPTANEWRAVLAKVDRLRVDDEDEETTSS